MCLNAEIFGDGMKAVEAGCAVIDKPFQAVAGVRRRIRFFVGNGRAAYVCSVGTAGTEQIRFVQSQERSGLPEVSAVVSRVWSRLTRCCGFKIVGIDVFIQ